MENSFISLRNLERFLENLRVVNAESLEVHTTNYNNPHKVTKSQIGLGNVDNTSDKNKPVSDAQRKYIDTQDNNILATLKAYTDSAKSDLNNIITSKTDSIQNSLNSHIADNNAHNITTRLDGLKASMTSYVDSSISNLIGGAPAILDTLYELSNALGNDPNFVTTITNMIGSKVNASDVVTTPTANKILKLNGNAQYPPSVIAQNATNRFFTDAERVKLAAIEAGATKTIITNNLTMTNVGTALDAVQGKWLNDNKAPISHITNYSNPHKVTKAQVGLGNADNTADVDKNVNTAKTIVTLGLKPSTDLPSTYPMGLSTHQVYNNGYPAQYGNIITSRGLGTGCTQFFTEWKGDGTGPTNPPSTGAVWYRSARDNINAWSTWFNLSAQEVHSKNYTDTKIAEINNKKPVGSKGQAYYIKSDNSNEVELSYIFNKGRFVENTAELNEEKSKTISFATVFNTWERFSIPESTEKNAWKYDSATDKVICTLNSSNFIGFVSPDKYDNYTHEATLSSIDGDDDLIGIMLACYKDPNTGKLYTLHATRCSKANNAGLGPTWGVIYNWNQSDKVVLFTDNDALKSNKGWSSSGQTRIRIIRNGDIITCETTAFGNTTSYLSQYKYTVNLTSNAVLEKFRGPKPYGYCCQSQNASTFSDIVFSDVSSMIVNLESKQILVYKNGVWNVDASKNIVNEIGVGKFLFNENTRKLFFIKDVDTITRISPWTTEELQDALNKLPNI